VSFFAELKRRNVFRVAGVYTVVSWVLVQVAAAIEEAMFLPVWFDTVVVSFLGLGLPIVLVFAWAFELTPEGIKRTADVDEDQSITANTASKLDMVLVVALIVFAGAMLAPRFLPQFATPPSETVAAADAPGDESDTVAADSAIPVANDASIAVLPFADLSPDGNQEYFADGISEELLNVLAKVRALKVAGRTSSFAFKNRDEDLREIGRILNVAHILEGSVRSQGDRVRVTAQLIQVSDGFHLWSETYDGDLGDIFAVQDDIATQILAALTDQLLVETAPTVAPATRTDVTAYGLFLEARDLIASRNVTNMQRARALLDEAIAIDPRYAPAYAARAQAYLLLTDRPSSYGNIPQHIALPKVRENVNRALELDPQLAQAHAVLGLLNSDAGRPDEARASLEYALELNPNSLDARNWLALSLVDTGQFREGFEQLKALLVIDPLYPPAANNGVIYADEIGELEEAKAIARGYIRRSRDPTTTAYYTGRIAWYEGRIADMIFTLESVPDEEQSPQMANWLSFAYARLGEFAKALAVPALTPSFVLRQKATHGDPLAAVVALKDKINLAPDIVSTQAVYIKALSVAGKDSALVDYYNSSYAGDLDTFATRLRGASNLAELQPFKELALAMKATGDQPNFDSAMRRWKAGIDTFRAGGSRSSGRDLGEAQYWAMAGDSAKSIALLAQAAEKQFYLGPLDFRQRAFDALKDNPDFLALRESNRQRVNEERAKMDWPPLSADFFVNPLLNDIR
jgi:TolB-like protein/tetratricopeptide (TPR) repeat protein